MSQQKETGMFTNFEQQTYQSESYILSSESNDYGSLLSKKQNKNLRKDTCQISQCPNSNSSLNLMSSTSSEQTRQLAKERKYYSIAENNSTQKRSSNSQREQSKDENKIRTLNNQAVEIFKQVYEKSKKNKCAMFNQDIEKVEIIYQQIIQLGLPKNTIEIDFHSLKVKYLPRLINHCFKVTREEIHRQITIPSSGGYTVAGIKANKKVNIMFIPGKGKGILKTNLVKYLSKKKEKDTFSYEEEEGNKGRVRVYIS